MYTPTGNGTSSTPRNKKERKVSLVFRHCDDHQHCAGIESVLVAHHSQRLFSASRDSSIKRWSLVNGNPAFEASFEGHVDWVNDVVLVNDTLLSCSNDKTVRMWRAYGQGECVRVLAHHSDYVTCMASAAHKAAVVSAGLRGEVFLIDVGTGTSAQMLPSTGMTGSAANGDDGDSGNKLHGSVYTLSMNPSGTLLAAGTTDHFIRLVDPRSGKKIAKLRGHTDNVRSVLLNADATRVLSGSSDSTVKLWDVGMQRCLQTFQVHSDSVWSLLASDDFNTVLSASKDGTIYRTQLQSRKAELIAKEPHPIQKLALNPVHNSVWAATSSSSINCWELPQTSPAMVNLERTSSSSRVLMLHHLAPNMRRKHSIDASRAFEPVCHAPAAVIRGVPGIVSHRVLPDRRHVLAKDVDGRVSRWDVLVGGITDQYGKIDMDEKEAELFEPKAVPTWFSSDNRLGCLTITMEPATCFLAEEYAAELHYPNVSDDFKVNYGKLVLEGAFAKWKLGVKQRSQMLQHQQLGMQPEPPSALDANAWVYEEQWPKYWSSKSLPSVVCQNSAGQLWRKTIAQLVGAEQEPEDIPAWVGDVLLRNASVTPKEAKCAFILLPDEGSNLPGLLQSKLNAPKILQVHKVVHYCNSKLMEQGWALELRPHYMRAQPSNLTAPIRGSSREGFEEPYKGVLEVTCNGMAVPFDMSLASVRKYLWRRPEDLIFNYRVADPNNPAPFPKITPST